MSRFDREVHTFTEYVLYMQALEVGRWVCTSAAFWACTTMLLWLGIRLTQAEVPWPKF